MTLSATQILGPEGRIAARLPAYEERHEQLEMAEAVGSALTDGHHLIVEAGTGVGKSFAYLVPAILAATEETDGKPRRILVSTHTISLQEQLIYKDLPLLRSVIPEEFTAVLVKGRGNYLSLRRLQLATKRSKSLFFREEELDQLRQLVSWSRSTSDGSLSDLPIRPQADLWDEVASDGGNCMGRDCATYQQCYYFQARRRAQHAQLLIVNHALFFTDLALRRIGAGVLPDYEAVILDEAHTMEAVASEHMGLGVTSGQVEYALNKLYNERTGKGLLVHHRLTNVQEQVQQCHRTADELFGDLMTWRENHAPSSGQVGEQHVVEDPLGPALVDLSRKTQTMW